MEKRKLGRTGVEVSRIGLGCVTFGREIDQDASFALMDYAVSHGITVFDTAEAYGGNASEKIIGHWLRTNSMRDRIFLVSKVTTNFTRQHVREALEASLERLVTDRLDLYLFHNFDRNTPLEEALEAIDEVKRSGLTRFIGCSNFTAAQTRQALETTRIDAVEAACNLALPNAEKDLLPLCAKEDLGFLAYSPLAAGFLTGKYSGDRASMPKGSRFDVIPGHADIYFNEQSFRALAELQAKEKTAGIPAVQLAIAWVLAHTEITSVLCGARAISHLENALAALKLC